MAELKTSKNKASVEDFLNAVEDKQKREDCREIQKMMQEITGEKPSMWGPSIVGFGSYHYKYETGREGDWFLEGFSPRKQNLTLYIMSGFKNYDALLGKLGKHSTGKSCLYIKRLSDIDKNVLKKMIIQSVEEVKNRYQ
jgi:hypothetical protein